MNIKLIQARESPHWRWRCTGPPATDHPTWSPIYL